MHEDITQRVIEVIAKNQHLDPSAIQADSTFEQLGIDSLDGLHILFAIEEEFGVDIPDDIAREFVSIQQAVRQVVLLLERKPVGA
jgi:acyl carrier protein